jgi:alkylhydroperoxidase family enzyme
MAWIRVIDEPDADGELREAYGRVSSARGRVANILKVHSLSPATMTGHLGLYRQVMFGRSELSRRERETIAVAVSAANACHY